MGNKLKKKLNYKQIKSNHGIIYKSKSSKLQRHKTVSAVDKGDN